METKRSFGQWVKQRRKALDMTQYALARRVGCALSTLQKIEVDTRQPSQQMAELLAEHLELAPDERATFLYLARHQANAAPLVLSVISTTHNPNANLPTPLTALIGREWEVATIHASLLRPEVRLLTITGPPGIGKTRLGLQVATELQGSFADGVCFVALAPVSDANFVIATIIRTLGIKDTGNQSPLAQLKAYFRHKQSLLVLDNFEHVLSAAPLIAELLEAAPHLKVLVTSRALLQLYGEHEFVTPPLALPDLTHLPTLEKLTHYAAVDLFVQRARAAKLEFVLSEQNAPSVAQLCVDLDGLPLAIELAAARSKQLAPEGLLARLANPRNGQTAYFEVLSSHVRNLPPRQQTLHNAIEWSYNLLTASEQRIFRAMSVFAGGCTLEALNAVADPAWLLDSQELIFHPDHQARNVAGWLLNTVEALVNQNLVVQLVDNDGTRRFTLLETIREYAREQLTQQGEDAPAYHTHTLYFLHLAERFKAASAEEQEADLLRRMEVEVDNFRSALRWADTHDWALTLRFTRAITEYWSQRRYLSEGRQWLEQLLLRVKTSVNPLPPEQQVHYAHLSGSLAFFTWLQGDFALAQSRWEVTILLWRELQNWHEVGLALHFLAYTFFDRGDYAAAYGPIQESVAILRKFGEPWALGWALSVFGALMTVTEVYDTAQTLFEEALTIFQRLGHTWSIGLVALGLSELCFVQGNLARARTWLEDALPVFQQSDQIWMMAQTLYLLGKIHWRQGDKTAAIKLWNESVTLAHEIEAKRFLAEIDCMLGLAAQEQEEHQQAQTLFCQSFTLYQAVENKIGVAYALCGLASLADQPVIQARLLGAASSVLDYARLPYDPIERTHYEQTVATVRGQLDETAFAAAWAQGQAMSLEQAFALFVLDAP